MAERVVVDDVDAIEVLQVAEVEGAAGEDEDAVDRRAAGEGDDLALGQLALAVGEQVDEDLAVAAARGGQLGVELADHAGVVAAVLGAKLEDVGDLGVALGADAYALVEAAVEEAEDHVLAEQGEPLAQREREAAGEHLTHAAHRGRAVDEHVVRALLVLHLLLVGEVEQLVVDVLLLEDVLVEGELGQLEVVDAAAALDRGVAVDREHLLAGVALDLEDAGQQLHREVDDVGEGRADHDVVEIREVDARGGLAGAAAEQAEQAQGVDVDLLDGEQREQAVGGEGRDPGERLALVVAGEGGARLDARVVGGVDGQLDRPQHADVVGELGHDAGEDAREHDADHRVAVLPAGLGADQVALGDLDEELAPGLAELGLGDAARDRTGRAEADDQAAEVVQDHQRDGVAEAGEDALPHEGAHHRQGPCALDLRQREAADLALELGGVDRAARGLAAAPAGAGGGVAGPLAGVAGLGHRLLGRRR